jgi:hypothetical protein
MLRIGQMTTGCTSLQVHERYNELSDFNFVGGNGAFSVSDSTYKKFSSTE